MSRYYCQYYSVRENQKIDKKLQSLYIVPTIYFFQLNNSSAYTVLTAGSGKEAISIFEKKHAGIDLVVLDMVMPGIGGGKVFDQIKKLKPDIKVLLSSGFSINGQATEILNRGCNGFIQKPFSMKELARKIREIIKSTEPSK